MLIKRSTFKIISVIVISLFFIQSFCIYSYLNKVGFSTREDNESDRAISGIFYWITSGFFGLNNEGLGEQGTAVKIPKRREEEAKKTFDIHQFNLVASDLMSLNRSLPDVRMPACLSKVYPKNLPDTSVIIVFHNEAMTTLLRTIHSVINRSPRELIHEIILVDDSSTFDNLKKPLEDYLLNVSVPTKLHRMPTRSGLIRARLQGAALATGATMLFLDSHCETTKGWLEPLLYEIYLDRRSVVAPIIDIISDQDFEYVKSSEMLRGEFDWKLDFRWGKVPERENVRRKGDESKPIETPTIAGGLFAIERNFFYEFGSYDDGMDVWGAENIEISFRTWMCHGRLLIATCSRVGHVFRSVSPYAWPGGINNAIFKNQMRTVIVWMDEYKEFYMTINAVASYIYYGDLSARLELKRKNNCRSFEWYLENIFPESTYPRSMILLGRIYHETSAFCLDTKDRQDGEEVAVNGCRTVARGQVWAISTDGNIISDRLCLDGTVNLNEAVKLVECNFTALGQKFQYHNQTKQIESVSKHLCISYSPGGLSVILDTCKLSADQQWTLQHQRKWVSPH